MLMTGLAYSKMDKKRGNISTTRTMEVKKCLVLVWELFLHFLLRFPRLVYDFFPIPSIAVLNSIIYLTSQSFRRPRGGWLRRILQDMNRIEVCSSVPLNGGCWEGVEEGEQERVNVRERSGEGVWELPRTKH